MKDRTLEDENEQQIKINGRLNDISFANAKLNLILVNLIKLSIKKLKFLNGHDEENEMKFYKLDKEIEQYEMDQRVYELLMKKKNGN